jgi:lysophospholipase L1-like esterase
MNVSQWHKRLCNASLSIMSTIFAESMEQRWVASWVGSAQGPYPIGNASAQPDLGFVFPIAETGARDQTFRLIVRPDIWGAATRLRFCNAFGTKPLTIDDVHIGMHLGGGTVLAGTNRPVLFNGDRSVTIPPGGTVWSDAAELRFVNDVNMVQLKGRKLTASFHVAGESGPMTWHAKALTTSYLTRPDAGSHGNREDEAMFPFSTTSWYFLDAIDMLAPADTQVVVAFGDSITEGTASTLNGDDRWPDVLSRRLHAVYSNGVSVVNAGIGGNQVIGPGEYSAHNPFPGGPSAKQRLERDVLSLSGVSTVIWLEGLNDFSRNGNASIEAVKAGMDEVVGRIRQAIPGVRVIGGTLTPASDSSSSAHGFPEQEQKRQALNAFIRESSLFDGFIDFDRVTSDPQTGGLRKEFVPNSTTGESGDRLHPNRAGYVAMGTAIPLDMLIRKPCSSE